MSEAEDGKNEIMNQVWQIFRLEPSWLAMRVLRCRRSCVESRNAASCLMFCALHSSCLVEHMTIHEGPRLCKIFQLQFKDAEWDWNNQSVIQTTISRLYASIPLGNTNTKIWTFNVICWKKSWWLRGRLNLGSDEATRNLEIYFTFLFNHYLMKTGVTEGSRNIKLVYS